MQQSKLQDFFQSFTKQNKACKPEQHPDRSVVGQKRGADDAKENRPPPGSISSMGKKQQGAAVSGSGKHPSKGRSKQMFLDLGQRDFNASKCSVCGMMYAKGHEEDEKLHKSFHQTAVQGLKFQGWTQERVLLSEPFKGRLLMVVPTDPTTHVKRVKEVCAFVERAHGMIPGWLMGVPNYKVFLYVSLQRRVVGVAVLEPLKQAYRVAATAAAAVGTPAAVEEVESLPATQQQQQQQQVLRPVPPDTGNRQLPSPAAAAAAAAAAAGDCSSSSFVSPAARQQQQQQQQQQRQLVWPGLHRSAAQGAAASSGTSGGGGSSGGTRQQQLLSAGLASSAGGGGFSVRADSCPSGFLAATQRVKVSSAAVVAVADAAAADVAACAAEVEATEAEIKPCGHPQQQQQQQTSAAAPGEATAAAPAAAAAVDLHKACKQQGPGSSKAAAVGSGGLSTSRQGNASGQGNRHASSGGMGSSSRAAGRAGSVLVDKRKPVRAMLGVRMVWVSAEQRRKGLATKLLDAARCNMIVGYVVPRNQLAFTQPTDEGAKLAASLTGTQQFMVYGIE